MRKDLEMIYSYKEQIEKIKKELEKGKSKIHILSIQRDGRFLDVATQLVYKNWNEVREKLSGTLILDNIPRKGDEI